MESVGQNFFETNIVEICIYVYIFRHKLFLTVITMDISKDKNG